MKETKEKNIEVGGDHYQKKIQPWDFIYANNLGFDEGNVVKYVSRHKEKGGAEDIRKAISYAEHILRTQYGEHSREPFRAARKNNQKGSDMGKEKKLIRTIEVTGDNWLEIFNLDCVRNLSKMRHLSNSKAFNTYAEVDCKKCVFDEIHQGLCPSHEGCFAITQGDVVEEYEWGRWAIRKNASVVSKDMRLIYKRDSRVKKQGKE